MRVPLNAWLPDQPPLDNPGSINIKNVYPIANGYKPVRALTETSTDALGSRALGAFSGQAAGGSVVVFAGDEAALYRLSSTSWNDVTNTGGAYAVAPGERWKFALYGSRVIATTVSEPVQYFDVGSSTEFDDIAGSPPQSRYVTVVRDFAVLANTTNSESEVIWSGFNDSEEWSAGTNQSGAQILLENGPILGIVGGEVGYIFQARGITRMTYVGPPLIFQFDEVARGVGLLAPSSLLRVGETTYFLGADGFYAFDGAGLTNIGDEKVNRWFNAQLAPDTLWQIHGAADTTSPLLYWSFVSVDSTDTTQPDKALIYNRAVDKFSVAEFAHELIFPGLSSGLTLEQIGGIYGALEDVPGSFDSASWAGGGVLLNAFSPGHKLAEFSGAALEAVLDTPEFEAVPFRRSRLIGLRPLCDSAAAIAKVKSRARLGDNAGHTATGAMQPNGDIPLLSSGRYHRAEITIPAGVAWTYIQGVDVEAVDDGGR